MESLERDLVLPVPVRGLVDVETEGDRFVRHEWRGDDSRQCAKEASSIHARIVA
jgi:hypothetical protein